MNTLEALELVKSKSPHELTADEIAVLSSTIEIERGGNWEFGVDFRSTTYDTGCHFGP